MAFRYHLAISGTSYYSGNKLNIDQITFQQLSKQWFNIIKWLPELPTKSFNFFNTTFLNSIKVLLTSNRKGCYEWTQMSSINKRIQNPFITAVKTNLNYGIQEQSRQIKKDLPPTKTIVKCNYLDYFWF